MPSLFRNRFCLLIGISFALVCFQANLVLAGGGSSTRRNRPAGRAPSAGGGSASYRGAIPGPESQATFGPQLPQRFDFPRYQSPVMDQSVQSLPNVLHRLGYANTRATVHENQPKELRKYESGIREQMQSGATRKQFLPLVSEVGMKNYLMPIGPLGRSRWPSKLGPFAGDRGITKAVIFSIYRPNSAVVNSRAIQVHGIAKIENAPSLLQPPEAARQLMHDLPAMLQF